MDIIYTDFTYMGAVNFTIDMINMLNGKVNNIFLANKYIIDCSDKSNLYGSSFSDTVIINVHNILKDALHISKALPEEFENISRGLITFTIMHELSHLDQDMYWYEKNIPDDAKAVIEHSCNAYSYGCLSYLLDPYSGLSIPALRYISVPPLYMIDSVLDNDNIILNYIQSYYKIKHPLQKIVYELNKLFRDSYDHSILNFIEENHFEYLYLILYIDNVKRDDILLYYQGSFVNYLHILKFLDPLLYYMYTQDIHIKTKMSILNDRPDIGALKIEVSNTSKIPIVNTITGNPITILS